MVEQVGKAAGRDERHWAEPEGVHHSAWAAVQDLDASDYEVRPYVAAMQAQVVETVAAAVEAVHAVPA